MVPRVYGLKHLWLEFEGRFEGSLRHLRQSCGLGRGHSRRKPCAKPGLYFTPVCFLSLSLVFSSSVRVCEFTSDFQMETCH